MWRIRRRDGRYDSLGPQNILSGSGSEREFTQRLGRILRPKDVVEDGDGPQGDESDQTGPSADRLRATRGGRAVLYEIVTSETAEERVAARRR